MRDASKHWRSSTECIVITLHYSTVQRFATTTTSSRFSLAARGPREHSTRKIVESSRVESRLAPELRVEAAALTADPLMDQQSCSALYCTVLQCTGCPPARPLSAACVYCQRLAFEPDRLHVRPICSTQLHRVSNTSSCLLVSTCIRHSTEQYSTFNCLSTLYNVL